MEVKNETKIEEVKELTDNQSETLVVDNKNEESATPTDENVNETTVEVENPETKDNTFPLKRLNEKFVYELMQVPTASHHEYRMVTFIIMWAKRNNIDYQMDDYGNIYLTKGSVNAGEYYPCVTAHLDTVQTKQTIYAKAGAKLDVKTKVETSGKHKIWVEGFGIGGDDKAGVLLGLSMFSYVDKLKACFFLEEETGCQGSQHLDKDWFNNVGYVIGYDSPDLNRAAYSCSGTKLMNKQFFEDNGLAEICANHGLNDFRAEPFTDVVQIRQKTNIICMNFGTGYYNCHTDNEYCIIEDMDEALDMGVDIINKLGNECYKMQHVGGSYGYGVKDVDGKYFESLNPKHVTPTTSYGGYNGNRFYDDDDYGYGEDYPYRGGSRSTSGSTTTTTPSTSTTKEDKINYEQIKYITEKYDEYILTVKEKIEAKCKEQDIDFDSMFSEIFSQKLEF